MDFKELNLYKAEHYATSESGGRQRARRQGDGSDRDRADTILAPSDQTGLIQIKLDLMGLN